jgi:hypothetical protein
MIENLFADEAAKERYQQAPLILQDMLTRWSRWYRRRIDVDIIESVLNSNAARAHAEIARTMFAGWPIDREVDDGTDQDTYTGTA